MNGITNYILSIELLHIIQYKINKHEQFALIKIKNMILFTYIEEINRERCPKIGWLSLMPIQT